MLKKFIINKNDFLSVETCGYYTLDYLGYNKEGNPDFLNVLKNTFCKQSEQVLITARDTVVNILKIEIPQLMAEHNIKEVTLCGVPRAKSQNTYFESQLRFLQAIKIVANELGVLDGSGYIERHTNTRTTHLPNGTVRTSKINNESENGGKKPYSGITQETCAINSEMIKGKDVILIDDIYTATCNIDEDCIQALIHNGAKKVIFYAVAKTVYNKQV